jgi:hypothetical protein
MAADGASAVLGNPFTNARGVEHVATLEPPLLIGAVELSEADDALV